jgi:hypothetical protein
MKIYLPDATHPTSPVSSASSVFTRSSCFSPDAAACNTRTDSAPALVSLIDKFSVED